MNSHKHAQAHVELGRDFLDAQKVRLLKLRDELIATADDAGAEEETIQFEAGGEARDDADGAEGMAIQENDEALYHRNLGRLGQVRRALERLEAGTYGLSERSGKPIPKERLIAVPEATLTLDEEEDQG